MRTARRASWSIRSGWSAFAQATGRREPPVRCGAATSVLCPRARRQRGRSRHRAAGHRQEQLDRELLDRGGRADRHRARPPIDPRAGSGQRHCDVLRGHRAEQPGRPPHEPHRRRCCDERIPDRMVTCPGTGWGPVHGRFGHGRGRTSGWFVSWAAPHRPKGLERRLRQSSRLFIHSNSCNASARAEATSGSIATSNGCSGKTCRRNTSLTAGTSSPARGSWPRTTSTASTWNT